VNFKASGQKGNKSQGNLSAQAGQATIEYILLVSTIMIGIVMVMRAISDMSLASKLARPINEGFARTYRYGHPQAKGYDDGGPEYHPRATATGANNFRIFINPGRP
jgi:hypothetical protein